MTKPNTLQQAIIYFSDPDNCQKFLVERHWPNGVVCPTCASKDVRYIATRRLWECKNKHSRKQFSVKVGTIFEDSPIASGQVAYRYVDDCQLQERCQFLRNRSRSRRHSKVRLVHASPHPSCDAEQFLRRRLGGKGGEVEVDETFIGGAARFMHRDKHYRRITETGSKGQDSGSRNAGA